MIRHLLRPLRRHLRPIRRATALRRTGQPHRHQRAGRAKIRSVVKPAVIVLRAMKTAWRS
jgi:hypothetical protein